MRLRKIARDVLGALPFLDAWFRRLVWSRVHFPEDELRLVAALPGRTIDVAIDVGGALGSYAWLFNRKARRVLVFEPGRKHADFLSMAAWFSRIELHRKAVGDVLGQLTLYTPADDVAGRHSATLSVANPSIDLESAQAAQVAVVTLDDVTGRLLNKGERVDLLKVDVEGFELAVFAGARETIMRDFPLIFCEIEVRHNAHYRRVFELLDRMGYRAFYSYGGEVRPLESFDISPLQSEQALAYRISDAYVPGTSGYINNFIFEHPQSRVRVSKGHVR